MAEDKFKLPRSTYEELCKIVKSYGRLNQPASLDDVAHLSVINKTTISANNAFLANVNLIEGGKSKAATKQGRALAKALEHELPEEIQRNWAEIVNGNEFLEKMAYAVKIRARMDSSALESHIAYSAGEAKSSAVMTGARAVVDILRAAGVVREHDGQLVVGNTSNFEQEIISTPVIGQADSQSHIASINLFDGNRQVQSKKKASIHIELRIDAKPSELEGLGEKIRKLLKDIEDTPEIDPSSEL